MTVIEDLFRWILFTVLISAVPIIISKFINYFIKKEQKAKLSKKEYTTDLLIISIVIASTMLIDIFEITEIGSIHSLILNAGIFIAICSIVFCIAAYILCEPVIIKKNILDIKVLGSFSVVIFWANSIFGFIIRLLLILIIEEVLV